MYKTTDYINLLDGRYVVHFLAFLTDKERNDNSSLDAILNQYPLALKKAKAIKGKKYHNKKYGGGIAFRTNDLKETLKQIDEIAKTDYSK